MINVGLMGLVFNSGNKGCAALAYSFVQMLNDIANKHNLNIHIYVFAPTNVQRYLLKPGYKKEFLPQEKYERIKSSLIALENGAFSFICERAIKICDMIFDFTAGDSFSDIYGIERFNRDAAYKEKIIEIGTPLVLGSQTYGPYKFEESKKRAVQIIKAANAVYARDWMSAEYVRKISGREPQISTDIAFALKYEHKENRASKKIRIGFNPSGLLWSGGYTKNNQFGLTVDYKMYCEQLIEYLLQYEIYEVHLIPHVFITNPQIVDNDLIACRELKEKYPSLIEAPAYKLPSQIKSYISNMDVFIGARMHATIGAFSAGIAVIPFSYSRKFEGLYSSLGYDYVISACQISTEEAINKTIKYIEEYKILQKNVSIGMLKVKELLRVFQKDVEKMILKVENDE